MLGKQKERQAEVNPESERMRMLIGLLAKPETQLSRIEKIKRFLSDLSFAAASPIPDAIAGGIYAPSFEPKAFAVAIEAMVEDFSTEVEDAVATSSTR